METLQLLIGPAVGLLLLAAASIAFGADSRDPMTDDHLR